MKRLFCIFIALFLVASCAIIVFTDGIDGPKTVGCGTPASTTPADWAKEDVEKAFEIGILDANKTYYFGSFITREEFCEIIYNLVNNKLDFTNGYKDVKSDIFIKKPISEISIKDTDTKAVFELIRSGIINGKKVEIRQATNLIEPSTDVIKYHYDVTFNPDDLLSREEAATIISRVLELYPDISYTEIYFEYDDEKDISDWAKGAVQKLSNAKIMEGYGNSVFYPKSALSTEEAVVIAVRAYNFINPEAKRELPEDLSFEDKINFQMPTDKNYMFSPLSIKMALSLAANGAEGETKNEILHALGIENLDEYNNHAKNLIELYTKTDKLQVNIANSVWLNESNADGDFSDEYKISVSEFYNAEVRKVNNKNTVKEINGWVNEKTNGKIPTIRNDADFWVSLINAVYFKGLWQDDFYEYLTKEDTFNNADGSKTEIPFMNKTSWTQYAETDNAKIITLPYKNNFYIDKGDGNYEHENYSDLKANMHFILSDSEINVEKELTSKKSENRYVKLSLPKFKFDYSVSLNDILKNIGIKKAFSDKDAEFSKMFTGSNLWIDSVLHKTFISVDEKGTEAAAVTEVGMAGSGLPPEPFEIKYDKPFYFVIEVNGEILFMGRYAYAE